MKINNKKAHGQSSGRTRHTLIHVCPNGVTLEGDNSLCNIYTH